MPLKNLDSEVKIINRDISWLSFNERVLQEAADPSVPILDRIKFLGIFSSNRDEFFKVRVASLKKMTGIGKKAKAILGDEPSRVLKKIQETVVRQQQLFELTYKTLFKDLEKDHIYIIDEHKLNKEQGEYARNYFHHIVRPSLVPIMLHPTRPFPYLKEKTTHLLVKLHKKKQLKPHLYSIVEVPSVLSRFVVLPSEKNKQCIMFLDDVIRYCLDEIFSIFDYENAEAYTIKLTRDSDLDIDDDMSKSMVEKITKGLKKRKKGVPVRLIYDGNIAPDMLDLLIKKLKLSKEDNMISAGKYHNFRDLLNFPDLGRPELKYEAMPPLPHPDLSIGHKSMFQIIRKKDILLTYPYQSFSHVIDLLREAAIDPKVSSIKIALYRVAKNSNVINTLINAAKNGKTVTVIMELQARFDEEANVYWADKLQEEGVKVIFGVPGLKVHSKILLITRKWENKSENFACIGTGNYNESTSITYSDHSLLTADKRIVSEVQKLFLFFNNNFKTGTYRHLLVSPFFMRKKILKLINSEIKNAKEGKKAFIYLKLNSLTDIETIKKLYEASKAGVIIKLIIRGSCSLVPGIENLSHNIEAISIVDRFLEHSRIYIFGNAGKALYYISSADIMFRNLDHRVEVACPILDPSLQKELKTFYEMQFKGNEKARIISGNRNNSFRKIENKNPFRAQYELYKYFQLKLM
jgi:polyphosphate kinase